jgi:hypothetical protein
MFTLSCKRHAFEKLLGHFLVEKAPLLRRKQACFFIEIIAFLSEMGQKMLHILPDFAVTHCNT